MKLDWEVFMFFLVFNGVRKLKTACMTSIEASLLGLIFQCLKDIKFLQNNYQLSNIFPAETILFLTKVVPIQEKTKTPN